MTTIPGYDYGSTELTRSSVSLEDLVLLKKTVLFTAEDEKYLKMAGEILKDQVDAVLDVWYGFVASSPHLVCYFSGKEGAPDSNYLSAVRKRFGQWILDTCNRPYDQNWLDYQYEIGLRHNKAKKNKTDHVDSVPQIHCRYLIAFIYPITATIKPFLEKKGHSIEEVDKMHQAWFKSIVLQATLWSYPYISTGQF